jgi:hypothetical protein
MSTAATRLSAVAATLRKVRVCGEAWAACIVAIEAGEQAAKIALVADPGRFTLALADDASPAQLSREISDRVMVVRNFVGRYAAPSAMATPVGPSWAGDMPRVFELWRDLERVIGRAELAQSTWLIQAIDSYDPKVTDYARTLGEKGFVAGGIQAVGDLAGAAVDQVAKGATGALLENPLLALGIAVALYVVLK